MKLEPVTKLDQRNKTTSKKIGDDVMSTNCDVIFSFWILGQFGAAGGRVPDTKSAKVTFPLIITFCLRKQNYKIFNTALILLL